MKSLKMLGFAVLAALLAMAFVGASSAMAESTTLCKAEESPCKETNWITHVHESTLSGAPATLLNSVGDVKCDVLFLGDTVAGTDKPLKISGAFTYENCKRGSENCTVKEVNGPVSISVLRSAAETAEVTGEGEVNVKCGIFINCTYNGEGLAGTGKGPLKSSETNGSVSISEQTTHKVGSGICPSEAKLDITTTPLGATYIAAPVMSCISVAGGKWKNNGGGGVCIEEVGAGNGNWELIG